MPSLFFFASAAPQARNSRGAPARTPQKRRLRSLRPRSFAVRHATHARLRRLASCAARHGNTRAIRRLRAAHSLAFPLFRPHLLRAKLQRYARWSAHAVSLMRHTAALPFIETIAGWYCCRAAARALGCGGVPAVVVFGRGCQPFAVLRLHSFCEPENRGLPALPRAPRFYHTAQGRKRRLRGFPLALAW